MRTSREALRARYRPAKVTILFVGESPPASGRFFYNRDSGLYRAMLHAFQAVDGAICDENFLDVFQKSGCYLIDACLHPVDRMDPASRRKACVSGEKMLVEKICDLKPRMIISLLRSIRNNVERAANFAAWHGTVLNTPYPGRWMRHKEAFLDVLVPQLRAVLKLRSQKELR